MDNLPYVQLTLWAACHVDILCNIKLAPGTSRRMSFFLIDILPHWQLALRTTCLKNISPKTLSPMGIWSHGHIVPGQFSIWATRHMAITPVTSSGHWYISLLSLAIVSVFPCETGSSIGACKCMLWLFVIFKQLLVFLSMISLNYSNGKFSMYSRSLLWISLQLCTVLYYPSVYTTELL